MSSIRGQIYKKISCRTSIDQQKGLENVCNFLDINCVDAPGPEEESFIYSYLGFDTTSARKARHWKLAQEAQSLLAASETSHQLKE